MAVIQRPAKQGNATTYQGKVAQGFLDILASEVDADLDTMYAAWNGGVDTVNIVAGSITADKLAPNQIGTRELADGGVQTVDLGNLQVTTVKLADLAVTSAKLADGAVTAAKLNAAAGGDLSGTYPNPAVSTISDGSLYWAPRGTVQTQPTTFEFYANASGSPSYDASKPSWLIRLDYANDEFQIWRAPAGQPTSFTKYFSINALSGVQCVLNNGTVTRPMLAVGTLIGNTGYVASPTAVSTPPANTWTTILTVPAITTRGPTGGFTPVLINVNPGLSVAVASGGALVNQRLLRNGATICASPYQVASVGFVPLPAFSWYDKAPSGVATTYVYQVLLGNAQCTLAASGDASGGILAQEFD